MLFAISLLFVFFLLGLMIYRSELFHTTSDKDYCYKEDSKTSDDITENIFFGSDCFKNTSHKDLLKKK